MAHSSRLSVTGISNRNEDRPAALERGDVIPSPDVAGTPTASVSGSGSFDGISNAVGGGMMTPAALCFAEWHPEVSVRPCDSN